MKKKIKAFFYGEIFFGVAANGLMVLLNSILYTLRNYKTISFNTVISQIRPSLEDAIGTPFFIRLMIMGNVVALLLVVYIVFLYEPNSKIRETGVQRITTNITIPVKAGNGEYGTRHFMTIDELKRVKELTCYKYNKENPVSPLKGGIVIGIRAIGELPPKGAVENIMCIMADRHALMVGATRSGKSRRIYLLSIWITILSGENALVNDPKGELYAYTSPFAKANDYQCVCIDLREPNRGSHHNYLQEIINAVKEDDMAEAIDLTWDLVAVLVGEVKGEPIWHNGECAAIAACILIVVTEAPEEYRNLTNVYYFLYNMAKPDEFGNMPISTFLQKLPATHPARAVFGMAEIAHSKTRGSFFSSALGTLKHFTNPKINEMTSSTDFSFEEIANKKSIVYIILPDEKKTLYSLGSMYIMQHYISLVKAAQRNGGRCPIDWWYFLDEFGQMPFIPSFPQFVTVGAGRGIRILLGLQDFQQVKKVYKEDFNTIKNNCEAWIYLKCSDDETLKEFSDRCGNYTIQVNSTNYSDKKENSGGSHGASLTGRKLLLPEEVGMIESPYALVCMAGKNPIMLITPDISYYHANEELGLGDEDFNRKLIVQRNSEREIRPVSTVHLWGIWEEYEVMEEYEDDYDDYSEESEEKISFLD